jgi:hypothetical protein
MCHGRLVRRNWLAIFAYPTSETENHYADGELFPKLAERFLQNTKYVSCLPVALIVSGALYINDHLTISHLV